MDRLVARWTRPLVLLALNLLYLMLWGFAGSSKILGGQPPWFAEKFGPTILGKFPGVSLSFWLLCGAEVAAFLVALIALVRGEFLEPRLPAWLTAALVLSLFVFLQLGFGLWLIQDFNGGFQQFVYFGVTMMAIHVAHKPTSPSPFQA